MRFLFIPTMWLVLLGVMACGGDEGVEVKLTFKGDDLERSDNGEALLRLGLTNSGEDVFSDDDFDGVLELRLLNKYGDLVDQMEVTSVGPIQPGETVYPLEWTGELEGSYFFWWGSERYGGVEVHFNIRSGGGLGRGAGPGIYLQMYRPILK